MNTSTILGFSALIVTALAGAWWLVLMRQVRVGEHRLPVLAMTMAASGLGLLALAGDPGTAGGVAAGVSVANGALFAALFVSARQATREPAIRIGSPVVAFTAPDAEGQPFDLATMAGRPFLLKFFRGHWCPYCVAELRRWEEMRPELDRRGIELVGICMDTPEKIRKGRSKHGLRATLLSDPDLAVTSRYNLVNHRGVSPSGIRHLPIPTTILVDAGGVVRWIDQATDYTVRSQPDRVLEAIRSALD